MSVKKICAFEKFGFCKLKRECNDYHPTEVCRQKICKISKCEMRHPRPCRFFNNGYCKFKDSCKYDHKKQIDTNELLEKVNKLEIENKKIVASKEKQGKQILILKDKLAYLENEYLSFLKKYSAQLIIS